MRKFACVFALVVMTGISAAAQEAPQMEFSAGYSFFRFNPSTPSAVTGQNFHGISGSAAYNLAPWIGAVADVGWYHNGNFAGFPLTANALSYTFGPRITLRGDKWEPFVHALFGGTRLSGTAFIGSINAFTMPLGGGLDYKLRPDVAIRLFQTEYVLTRFNTGVFGGSDNQHDSRISGGIVFRLGSF